MDVNVHVKLKNPDDMELLPYITKTKIIEGLDSFFAFLIYFIFYSITFKTIHIFFVTLRGRSELMDPVLTFHPRPVFQRFV